MDLGLLSNVMMIILILFGLIALWAGVNIWKRGSKFLGFVFIAIAIAVWMAVYAIYGNTIRQLFQ